MNWLSESGRLESVFRGWNGANGVVGGLSLDGEVTGPARRFLQRHGSGGDKGRTVWCLSVLFFCFIVVAFDLSRPWLW